MQTGSEKPMAVPSSAGRKLHVIGHKVTIKLTCRETDGEYFVFEDLTPPVVGVPLHVHRHEDEFFRVLEGEFEFQLDQQIQKVATGAMGSLPKGIPHAFRNVGTTPGRILFTVMPGGNVEKFFEELGSLPADREPDMGKVTEIFNRHDIEILPPHEMPRLH